jgi:hypothetical protein
MLVELKHPGITFILQVQVLIHMQDVLAKHKDDKLII